MSPSNSLVVINEGIERLKIQLIELEKQKKEEESKPILNVTFSHLDKKLNRVRIYISDYDDRIVNIMRNLPSRFVLEDGKANVIHLTDMLTFGKGIDTIEHTVEFSPPSLEQEIKDIIDKPNLTIELGPDSKKCYIYPNIFTTHFFPIGLDSFHKEFSSNFYTLDANELWRLPIVIANSLTYKEFKVKYSDGALKLLETQVSRRDRLTLLSKAEDSKIEVPLINGELFHGFQRVALEFAKETDFNCILALDMGLGKTPISIAIGELLQARVLYVVPATLKTNTYREIKKWTGEEALVLSGAAPTNAEVDSLLINKRRYNIINYDVIGRETKIDKSLPDSATGNTIMKWVELINAANFDLIICDEAHYIKNMSSLRSKGTRSLKAPHKIGLTGTPIVNRPSELYPILNVVAPDKFSRESDFMASFMNRDGTAKNVSRLHELLQDYMFRKKKEDVIKELPPISRFDHFTTLSPEANKHYVDALNGLYVALRNPNYKREINSILAMLTRLKQIIADDKIEATVQLALEAYEETGQKVLIYSQFVDTCLAIRGMLPDSLIITGLNNDDERYERIDKFQNDPSIKYMVLSTKAGAEGITLTAAHTVIFNDLCWTPKDHRQAEARCYGRMSDMHGAVAYYVQASKTVDEMIMALLMKKLGIIEEVVDNLHTDQGSSESIVNDLLAHLKAEGDKR